MFSSPRARSHDFPTSQKKNVLQFTFQNIFAAQIQKKKAVMVVGTLLHNRYKKQQLLGQGSFGAIYKGKAETRLFFFFYCDN